MYSLDGKTINARTWRRQFHAGPALAAELTAVAFKTLAYLGLLESIALRDRPFERPHLQPAQGTIAAACNVARETINRAINKVLVPLRLVETRYQWTGASGQFRTCAYRLTKLARRTFGVPQAPPAPRTDRVMYPSHHTVECDHSSNGFAHILGTGPPHTE